MDWHQAHWLELARQSSQVRRLGVRSEDWVTPWLVCTHTPTPAPWAQWGSLAAERGTLLGALQGTLTPASPAACCVPFAVGALMPLTEGVLGVGEVRAQLSPLLPSPTQPLRPPLQAPYPLPLPASPDFPLQPATSMASACPAPSRFGHKNPFVWSSGGRTQSLGPRGRQRATPTPGLTD